MPLYPPYFCFDLVVYAISPNIYPRHFIAIHLVYQSNGQLTAHAQREPLRFAFRAVLFVAMPDLRNIPNDEEQRRHDRGVFFH